VTLCGSFDVACLRGTSVAPGDRANGAIAGRAQRGGSVKATQLMLILTALVLGIIAGGAAVASQASISVQGQVSATDQESDEGYFAVGADTMVVAKPRSALHQWLRAHNDQQVRVTIELDQPTQ
jgi:hypothetical protein